MRKIFCVILMITAVSLTACGNREADEAKILYYAHPDNSKLLSDVRKKTEDGRDYVPVYAQQKISSRQEGEVWYYTCPMHPDVKTHQPGSCPICKMDLVAVNYPAAEDAKIDYYYCPMHPEERSDRPGNCRVCGMRLAPMYIHDEHTISSIELSPEQQKKINLQTTAVQYRKIARTIGTVGKINYDEKKMSLVSARIGGRVDKLFVNYTGQTVSKSQPLLLIYSPDLITAQKELIQAYRDYSNSSAQGQDRLTELSRSLFESSKSKLKLWGLGERQVDTILKQNEPLIHIPIYSPLAGTVIKLNVTTGMYVQEGTVLYEIADLSRVWMEAEVYEQDIGDVKINSIVDVRSVSYPGKTFKGKVTFIYPFMDSLTRTVKIRAELDNREGLLKPGMYTEAEIASPQEDKILTVPASALLDTGIRKVVYVAMGNGKFEGRSVTVKPRVGDYFPVISGLNENEEVVTYGAFLIDSQAELKGNSSIQYSSSLETGAKKETPSHRH